MPSPRRYIRNATVGDAEPIARLLSELGYDTSTRQMRRRLEAIVRDEDYDTLVACDAERIVGFVGTRLGHLYEADGQYGQIMALAVATGHRRRGIGRMLMQAAESRLLECGAGVLVVTSGNHRADAHAFYERCGDAFTGRPLQEVGCVAPMTSNASSATAGGAHRQAIERSESC